MYPVICGTAQLFMHQLSGNDKPLLLVFPHNLMAHYLRCLQLSKYLTPYFNIRFLYSPLYQSFVSAAGFKTFTCEALDAEKVQQGIISFNFSWLNEKDISLIYHAQVNAIRELNPSAVLGDLSPTLKMAAEKTGVRYFSLINGYMSQYYTYVRRMPRQYPLNKLFDLIPSSLSNHFIVLGEQISFHDIHRPFSKIRKREGLSSKYSYLQEMEGDVNLLCDLPELFPQKDLPENYFFIPPLYYGLKNDSDKIIENLDRNKKTLYVSMGSSGDWQKIAFLNNDAYRSYNILTSGDYSKIIQGPNVISFSFINSAALFAEIDLVICHGGNGTTYQALSYGIPVLCKTSHVEQEYNVDGLERLRLGKCLDDIDPEDYETIIEYWIQRKGSPELLSIKNKIAEANNKFENIIDAILLRNLPESLSVVNTVE